MPVPIIGRPVDEQVWENIRAEYNFPALEQVHRRLTELVDDPEPVMQQLVRVFIGDGTFCPGFQFLPGGQLHVGILSLFRRALELRIPHNYFSVWMVTPSVTLCGARPVDSVGQVPQLHRALEGFAAGLPG